jgi:hypothetical protein
MKIFSLKEAEIFAKYLELDESFGIEFTYGTIEFTYGTIEFYFIRKNKEGIIELAYHLNDDDAYIEWIDLEMLKD